MKRTFLVFISLCGATYVSSQSLTPQVIASSGNSFSSGSAQIEFTIGEVATTSLTAGGNTMTQGFHQPEISYSSLQDFNDAYQFTLYPNPTEQFITVQSSIDDTKQIRLYDAVGKEIMITPVFNDRITVDLQTLAAGSYVFYITTEHGKPLHSYTVIKK
jgi:type 1 fimbria pilin